MLTNALGISAAVFCAFSFSVCAAGDRQHASEAFEIAQNTKHTVQIVENTRDKQHAGKTMDKPKAKRYRGGQASQADNKAYEESAVAYRSCLFVYGADNSQACETERLLMEKNERVLKNTSTR